MAPPNGNSPSDGGLITSEPQIKFDENAPFLEKLKHGYHPMNEGVRWSEKYAEKIEITWSNLPKWCRTVLATLAIFIFASSLQGDWIVLVIHILKQFGFIQRGSTNITSETISNTHANDDLNLTSTLLTDNNKSMSFDHLWYFIISAAIGSYTIYFTAGGFLHWYFYVRQRDRAHEWKCQPTKWLAPELERHEIMIGSLSLLITSTITGFVACYIYNEGPYQKIYYEPDQFGWLWFFLQVPILFIYQDYLTYVLHRTYHIPFLYKHFHKLHHKYKQPTAFSVTAIHPVEIVNVQLVLMLPIVVIPMHWAMFYAVVLYTYYHAILDHSGIAFKAQWWQPWQPDAIFHDNHHQYTHVNFGFNIYIWDKLHGTYRRKDRVYGEDIFYGKGLALNEVPQDVLQRDIDERNSENPLAYPDNVNINKLTSDEMIKKEVKNLK